MTKVHVNVHTNSWMDDDGDPPDVEWGNRNTEHTEVTGMSVYLTDKSITDYSYGRERDTVDLDIELGDCVYVVLARYSSGDTFGNSYGHAMIMDVFATDQEALDLKAELEKPVVVNGRIVEEFERTVNGKTYYIPWTGYFEVLERIELHAVIVGKESSDSIRYW